MPDQLLQLAFTTGLDGRTDPHSQQVGALAQAVNVVFDKSGAVRKRHGNNAQGNAAVPGTACLVQGTPGTAIGGATMPASPYGYLTSSGEQNIAAGTRLYTYAPDLGAHVSKDDYPEAIGTRRPLEAPQGQLASVPQSLTGVYNPDVAVSSDGFTCYVWQTSPSAAQTASVAFAIYDQAQGGGHGPFVYGNPGFMAPVTTFADRPKVIAVGTAFVILWTFNNAGTSLVYAITITHSIAGWSAGPPTVVSTYAVATVPTVFDVAVSGTNFLLATAAPTTVLAQLLTPDLGMTGTYAVVHSANLNGGAVAGSSLDNLAIAVNGANVWIAWHVSGTSLWLSILNASSFTSVLAATQVTFPAGASLNSGLTNYLAMVQGPSSSSIYLVAQGTATTGIGLNAIPIPYSLSNAAVAIPAALYSSGTFLDQALTAVSRPVYVGSKLYLMCWVASLLQGGWVWIDTNVEANQNITNIVPHFGPRVVCSLAPRLATGWTVGTSVLASVAQVSPGVYVTPIGVILGGAARGATGTIQLWEAKVDYTHPNRALGSRLGRQTVASSHIYDTQLVTELGFLTYPEGYTVVGSNSGSGHLTPGATYLYAVLWEWTTAAGELVQSTTQASANAQLFSITLSGGQNQATITFHAFLSTTKFDSENSYATPPTLGVYRSQAGGSTLTKIANIAPTNVFNAVYPATYLDQASDTSIAGNYPLYFTPGQQGTTLDNISPPSFSHTIVPAGFGRIFGIGDDLRTIWPSKLYTEGFQPGFNELLTFTIEDGGDLVALATINQNLIIFTQTRIYITQGQGPDNTGGGTPFAQPQPIQTDVGCIDPRSIVAFTDGLLFLSQKGLCVLGQDMSINYIDAAELVLAAFPNLTSAVLVPEHQEIRIELNNGLSGGAAAGVTLVLNYWGAASAYKYRLSTFQKYDAAGAQASCVASAAGYLGGYRWAAASGFTYAEDTTGATYMDGGTGAANWVTMLVQTGWLATNGIVGYQRGKRVGLIGDWYTSFDLTIGIATEFNPSTSGPTGQSRFFQSSSYEGGPLVRVRAGIQYQKHQAVQFTITDAYPTGADATVGTGRGFSLAGLALQAILKGGLKLYRSRMIR
jgi:hypothetical protein